MKGFLCRMLGHIDVFVKTLDGGLYYRDKLQMPTKQYRCQRCGRTIQGVGLTKEDHTRMMELARSATLEATYQSSVLPERVTNIEKRLDTLDEKIQKNS